jgi:hypothetical protein
MTPEPEYDDFWDNLFLGCAFAAYVELAVEQQGEPDSEATRRLAYRYYEEALAEKNRRSAEPEAVTDPQGIDQAVIA